MTSPAGTPSPTASTASTAALQRRTLVVLAAMQILGTIGVGVGPSVGILLAGDVTDDEALAGLARTASTLGAALLGAPLGSLAARSGRRVALAGGWWIGAIGSGILVLTAQFQLVVPLFLGLLLLGAGSATALQSRFAATDLAEPRHRGRSLAIIVWVGMIGSVLGPNLGIPGKALSGTTGLSVYAGAFLIAALCMTIAGGVVFALLRPDPLLVLARRAATIVPDGTARGVAPHEGPTPHDGPTPHEGAAPHEGSAAQPLGAPHRGSALGRLNPFSGPLIELCRADRAVRYPVVALLSAQAVMVAIMTMTPLHIVHHGGSIELVGVTISLHIVGMFGLAPLVGYLADRIGPRATIGIGIAILVVSLAFGALLAEDHLGVIVSLVLLGLGWSFVNVASSVRFSAVIPDDGRAPAQGSLDALANYCAAIAAFLAGPLLAISSFSILSIVAMLLLVPMSVMTLRRG